MLKKITNPVFFLPYLTICGAGYHMSFWNEFGLNGLNFISLADIVKSAAQPISYPIVLILLSSFIYYIIIYLWIKLLKIPSEAFTRVYSAHLSPSYWLLSVLFIIMGVLILNISESTLRWMHFAIIVSSPLIWLFFANGFLLKDISDPSLRFSIICLIVLLPFLSFSTGKMDAEVISKNITYKYVLTSFEEHKTQVNRDTLKLIGFTTENVVFSSLENDEIIILDRKMDTLSLKSKGSHPESLLQLFYVE